MPKKTLKKYSFSSLKLISRSSGRRLRFGVYRRNVVWASRRHRRSIQRIWRRRRHQLVQRRHRGQGEVGQAATRIQMLWSKTVSFSYVYAFFLSYSFFSFFLSFSFFHLSLFLSFFHLSFFLYLFLTAISVFFIFHF